MYSPSSGIRPTKPAREKPPRDHAEASSRFQSIPLKKFWKRPSSNMARTTRDLPVATRLLNAIHDPAAMRLSTIRDASLIDFPLYHAGSGRPKDARFPQNAAHFGSPRTASRRLRRP